MSIHDLVAAHLHRSDRRAPANPSAEDRYYRDHNLSPRMPSIAKGANVAAALVLVLILIA